MIILYNFKYYIIIWELYPLPNEVIPVGSIRYSIQFLINSILEYLRGWNPLPWIDATCRRIKISKRIFNSIWPRRGWKFPPNFDTWWKTLKDSTSFPFPFFAIIRQRTSIVSSISLDPSSCKSEPSLKKLDLDALQERIYITIKARKRERG